MAMAGTHSTQVELPDDLFEQIREAAERSDQPMESVLIDTLSVALRCPVGGLGAAYGNVGNTARCATVGPYLSQAGLARGSVAT